MKPANIMLTRSGAKLMDFGLAKLRHPQSVQEDAGIATAATGDLGLTGAGMILGTPRYMAPEQLEGKESDPRTDIFALGTVLYEMATGRPAFEGKIQASLISAIMSSQPPPISRIQPAAPPALEGVVRRCLAKDPEERWQSAQDIALQLKWISEEKPPPGIRSETVPTRRKHRFLIWIPALVVFTVLAFPLTHLVRQGNEKYYLWPSFPPDGRHFLYMERGNTAGRISIHAGAIDSQETKHLLDAESGAFFDPAGFLVFERNSRLYAQGFDASALKLHGDPILLAENFDSPSRNVPLTPDRKNAIMIACIGNYGLR